MATDRYLERIGFDGPIRHDVTTVEALQRAHLTAVPFENLDVYHRRGVATGIDWSVPKIVERGRGGWCYELNGAFSALLESLGFTVTRLGATVLLDDSTNPSGTDPDHLARCCYRALRQGGGHRGVWPQPARRTWRELYPHGCRAGGRGLYRR